MTNLTTLRSAVCIAALVAGTTAQADITAAEVWEDWKSQMMQYGEENVSIGAEETSSGTVTVRDVMITFADPEVSVETQVGDILFNEQSDGTVRVTLADSIPMSVSVEDGTVINISMDQTNLEILVSGTADAFNYDVTADEYKVAYDYAENGDVTVNGDAALTATNLEARYETEIGDVRETSYSASIDVLDLLVDFVIPGGAGEYITAAAKYNNLSTQGELTMPLDMDFSDPDAGFPEDMVIAGGYLVESTDFVVDVNADGEQFAASGSTGQTTLTGNMSFEALGYAAEVNDVTVNAQTSEFPLPIEVSMAKYGIGLDMPIGESEQPVPLGIVIELVDVVIGDSLWNLFDGGNVLPRDPATVQLSLQGTGKALFDMMDPDSQMAMAMGGGQPFELETLNLETLNIDVAGAQVTGEGAFTFDNSDMQTFAPLPRPLGAAAVQINGLNKLLDNLVAMGLVPAEDVMGPRMMMGMFARSTGDDQMEIGVEVNDAGEVLVNGNRVR